MGVGTGDRAGEVGPRKESGEEEKRGTRQGKGWVRVGSHFSDSVRVWSRCRLWLSLEQVRGRECVEQDTPGRSGLVWERK
jgi:hypothetical protein